MLQILRKYSAKSILQNRYHRAGSTFGHLIDIHPEVQDALQSNGPIVALESTIISHGMPFPANLQTAKDVENCVRQQKAIPATIAVMNGRIKIGLNDDELMKLANWKNGNDEKHSGSIVKTSRRDLAYVLSHNDWIGGTTVAGTLIAANLAGIDIMATGGIGGVHRDGENTMDVSADLIELGRSQVTVVASGVKSILDIPRTLEYLETHGICVAAYQTNKFPAFYTQTSGCLAPYSFVNPGEVAQAINVSKQLQLGSGMLLAVPIPVEYSLNEIEINRVINDALNKCKAAGIFGKEITPFLLSEITKITKGKSLEANIELVKNNAKIAAKIAVQLSRLRQSKCTPNLANTFDAITKRSPVVIGGSIVDTSYTVLDHDIGLHGATYPSSVQVSAGGVGRNLAECIWKIYGSSQFISMIGNDENGKLIQQKLPIECRHGIVVHPEKATANSAAIFDRHGDAKLYLCDMTIHSCITSKMIIQNEQRISNAPLVIVDGNLSVDTMLTILDICQKHAVPVFYEPTDMFIAGKIFEAASTSAIKQIKFISPNIYELYTIAKALNYPNDLPKELHLNVINDKMAKDKIEFLHSIKNVSEFLNQYFDNIIVTLGPLGILLTNQMPTTSTSHIMFDKNTQKYRNYSNAHTSQATAISRYYPIDRIENISNVSGAGDSFASGFISAALYGLPDSICISVGFEAARIALASASPVANQYFDQTHLCWKTESQFEVI